MLIYPMTKAMEDMHSRSMLAIRGEDIFMGPNDSVNG